jgi:hypothetical protein
MAALFLLSYQVGTSAGHTIEVFPWKPLGSWRIVSPGGLALFYALVVAGLFAIYALAARRCRGLRPAEALRVRRVVYGGAIAMILVLLFVPQLLSKDVFDYMVHGRILAVHRANPFEVPAAAFGADDFFRAMGWPQYTALYGPGWISTCALLAWISPGSVAGTLVVYKLVFGVVHLANGLLIGVLLRSWGRPTLTGEVLYLWNPLVLGQVAGQAHNDGFLIFWVLTGLVLMRREPGGTLYEEALGTVCLTLSVLVKYVTAPVLLFALAARWRQRGGWRGLRRAVALGIVATGVVLVGYMPYAGGMDVLHFLRPYDHGAYQGGSLMLLQMALHKYVGEEGAAGERAGDLMLGAATAMMLATAAAALVLALRTRTEEDAARHGLYLLFGYVLAATALLRISYGVWIVALAALLAPGVVRGAALIFSLSLMALDVFWVYAIRMVDSGITVHREKAAAAVVAVGVPVSYLLAGLARHGRARGRGEPA